MVEDVVVGARSRVQEDVLGLAGLVSCWLHCVLEDRTPNETVEVLARVAQRVLVDVPQDEADATLPRDVLMLELLYSVSMMLQNWCCC